MPLFFYSATTKQLKYSALTFKCPLSIKYCKVREGIELTFKYISNRYKRYRSVCIQCLNNHLVLIIVGWMNSG